MQDQTPGYAPKKKVKGVKVGSKGVRTGAKPKKVGNNGKRIQKRSKGKTTKMSAPKSMAMNNGFQNIQAQSNMPGFNFPGASPLL